MVPDDLIRLAWEADHDGRSHLRDSLLTLAVLEGQPGDAWVARCRARLVAERPDHFLGQFATIDLATQDRRVLEAWGRLRAKYPAVKVCNLLLKAGAGRGPYLGRAESLEALLDDLAGPPAEAENVRRDAAQASRGPLHRHRAAFTPTLALAYPTVPSGLEAALSTANHRGRPGRDDTVSEPPAEDVPTYYLTVLLAIAFLLASVQDTRAA